MPKLLKSYLERSISRRGWGTWLTDRRSASKKSTLTSRIITDLIEIALFITGPLTIAGFLGKFGWVLELTCHFRFQYLVTQLLCVVFFLVIKRWGWLAAALLCASMNMTQTVPLYIDYSRPDAVDANNSEKLKVLLMNVNVSNTDYSRTIQYIKEINPDLLALEEISKRWLSALSPILTDFPFKEVSPREDCFGMGLFSRIPLEDSAVRYFGEAGTPSIVSKTHIKNQPVTILLTHPLPPATSEYFRLRNDQLEEIASFREDFGDRLIVLGDLNTTSWSHYYKRFISRMKLYDSRKGFGIQPSWPTAKPFMLIPLDHCLLSHNIVVLDRRIGPNVGSDHYPVYIELAF